jgi:hypothetical protein
MVVLTNSAEGRDAEFNAWYDGVHLKEILAIDGIVAGQRFEVAPEAAEGPYRYCTVYEIETDDLAPVLARVADPSGRAQSDSVDRDKTAVYFFGERGDRISG